MLKLNARTFLIMLAEDSSEADNSRRRLRISAILALIVGGIGFVGVTWVIVQAVIYGWATANWDRLDAALNLPTLFISIILFSLTALFIPLPRALFSTRTLREAIVQGDERVVAMAPLQPAPLEEAALVHTEEFHALRRLSAVGDMESRVMVIVLPLMFSSLFLINLPSAVGSVDWANSPLLGAPLLIPIALFGPILLGGIVSATLTPSWDVIADAKGLTWRRRGRGNQPREVSWAAIQSFFKATTDEGAWEDRTTFIVDTGDDIFSWALGERSKNIEFIESEHLSRVIVSRSGQPLRELTPSIDSLVPRRVKDRTQPTGLSKTLADQLTLARKRIRHRLLALLPIFLLLLIPLVAIFPGKGWIQDAQRAYFAEMVPQIDASHQLFHDSLTADDGQWPIATPNATSNVSRVFTQGSYQVAGGSGVGDDASVALVQPIFGDAAVEVTTCTIGFGDVGLALRAQSDHDMIAFTVNQASGQWTLTHYRYLQDGPSADPLDESGLLDYGTSSAVHTAPESVNRLLVVMRGSTYLLYINDTLVDVTDQRYEELALTQGQVGVMVWDNTVTGSFSNFVVYAIQPQSSTTWV